MSILVPLIPLNILFPTRIHFSIPLPLLLYLQCVVFADKLVLVQLTNRLRPVGDYKVLGGKVEGASPVESHVGGSYQIFTEGEDAEGCNQRYKSMRVGGCPIVAINYALLNSPKSWQSRRCFRKKMISPAVLAKEATKSAFFQHKERSLASVIGR